MKTSELYNFPIEVDFYPYHAAIIASGGMDLAVARENLDIFIELANRYDIETYIIFGTLLGMYRDRQLISYDTDVDLAFCAEDLPKVKNLMVSNDLAATGFYVGRVWDDNQPNVISFCRKSEFLDMYTFYEVDGGMHCNDNTPNQVFIEKPQWDGSLVNGYLTFTNPEALLERWYGADWRIPKNTKF